MAASPSPNDLTRQQLDELDALLQRMLALPISQPEPAVAFPPPPPLPDLPPLSPRSGPRPTVEPPAAVNWRADPPEPTGAVARAPYTRQPQHTPAPEPAVAFIPSVLPFPAGRGNPEPVPPAKPEAPAPRLFAPPPVREVPPPVEEQPHVAPNGTLRGVDAPALPFDFTPANLEPPHTPTPSVEFAEVNPFADPLPPVPPAPAASAPPVPMPLWPLFAVNWVLEFVLGWFGPIGDLLTRPAMKTLLGWVGVLLLLGAGVWAARGMGWVSWPR